jgi:hypothetical protein
MSKSFELFGPQPRKDRDIWRYTTLAKLLNMVGNDQDVMNLVAFRADEFEDDYEGTLSEKAKQKLEQNMIENSESQYLNDWGSSRNKYTEKIREDLKKDYYSGANSRAKSVTDMIQKMRKLTFANCWNIGKYEDSNMWGAYTTQTDGVVIKTTYDSITDSIVDYDGVLYLGSVDYIDFEHDKMKTEAIAPFFFKQRQFKSEAEFRFVVTDYKTKYLNPADGVKNMPSVPNSTTRKISVNPTELIEEVRVHPKSGNYLKEVIERVFSRENIDAEVKHSSLRPSLS